jgi:NADPH:quinone reductase-like Zn-dependent oxidoreductase
MKAAIFTRYGPPDVLELREVPRPTPGPKEILIRIHAATVTAGDTEMRRLKLPPWLWIPMRLYGGLIRPKRLPILGMELSGVVEAAGADVTRFAAGDEVFAATGFGFGGYAEYVCLRENAPIARKPAELPFEEAAAVPIGGLEALSFVRRARIQPGRKVLIYGGSGSIGTYAVQLARQEGADVTAVCNPTSLELVRSLGASRVIDYTKEDFTAEPAVYDVIIDAIGKCPFARAVRKLAPDGRYLLANPKLRHVIAGAWISLLSSRSVVFGTPEESVEDLEYLGEQLRSGKIKVVVDRKYRLDEIAKAHEYVDIGHKTGNVIITMN